MTPISSTNSVATKASSAAGFTLLEMMLVLAVLALAAGIAAPRLTRLPDQALLNADLGAAAALLRGARLSAVGGNRAVTVAIDVAERVIHIDSRHHAFDADARWRLRTGAGLLNGMEAGHIIFFPDGSTTGGSLDMTRGAATGSLRVDWLSGRIEGHRHG